MILEILLLGLGVGVLVGLFGIGGGVVLVPAMVCVLGMDQHMAQGTSLFVLLPPLGLGALVAYWKCGQVDVRAGILCAMGMLAGGYLGSRIAIPLASRNLKGFFGCFLMLAALLLWRKISADISSVPSAEARNSVPEGTARSAGILAAACASGVGAGMFGVGGGVLLVPFLVLLFAFSQHRAQGTSLVALIFPTGLAAFITYAKAGFVSWLTGVLLIPGILVGGILGGVLAKRIKPLRMRQAFAGMLFALGAWQAITAWRR
jgi:uncharacterized membrane protein YfcA